jgi:outer membrane lipoprotein-sorting protein
MKSSILTILLFFFVVNNSLSNPIVKDIENNWNEIKSMSGQFEQIDQEGNIFNGQFFFLKPFKSKFIYNGREEDIITNKSLMVVVDKEGHQIDSFPIGDSILKKLLSEDILIKNEFDIISLTDENNFYHLMLKIKDDKSDNQIKFVFDRQSLNLKKWEIYDEFDNKTVFKFTKIKKNIFISQNLFVVKYN